jgi:hypothetical protein
MKLFTITASIMALVAGMAIAKVITPDQLGHAYLCGRIAGEAWARGEIMHDTDVNVDQELEECDTPHELAKKYETKNRILVGTGQHTVQRSYNPLAWLWGQSVLTSFAGSKSLASTP